MTKKLIALVMVVSVLAMIGCDTATVKETAAVTEKATAVPQTAAEEEQEEVDIPEIITFPGGKLGEVTFRHSEHFAMDCDRCHHYTPPNEMPKACRSCHIGKGKGPLSPYAIYHLVESKRSCGSCHYNSVKTGLITCTACHKSKKK